MDDLEKNSITQFTRWAKNYDNPITSFTFRLTNSKIASILNPKPNSSLLDVGCGTGILISKLLSRNKYMRIYGLDITPKMVEVAKDKFKDNPHVKITLGSAVHLPYQDNTFDYVACASSLHHHPDPLQSVKEMVRVLKPGGELLILDMCIEGLIRQLFFKIENIYHHEGKVFRLTNKEMIDLYQQVGLKQIKQSTFLYFSLITEGVKHKQRQ